MTETNDPVLILGFAGAALLNAVLALQFFLYRGNSEKKELEKGAHKVLEAVQEKKEKVSHEIGMGRPASAVEGTPVRKASGTPSRTSSPASSRYVRKLD